MNDLVLGAVAYDPKVVTIWAGFRTWLRERDFPFDFILYSNYERQVDDLLAGRIDVAWNSPLAWVRARRLAAAGGVTVRAIAMRDTDRDLVSAVVVCTDSSIQAAADLHDATIAVGAIDSPQATLLPLSALRRALAEQGLDLTDAKILRHDVGVGLHGDHIGGERDAAVALRDGRADAACLIDANLLLFAREGTLPAGSTRVIAQTPRFDHCNMTAGPTADAALVDRFATLLLEMSYADPRVRPLLDLEGLTRWLPGRLEGYTPLEAAVDETGFYDDRGGISASDYRP
jgi:ABC-type phosphate/phosphonate transport system substrate-binding protein